MSTTDTVSTSGEALAGDIERLGERLRQARQSIGRVIFGQQPVIDQTLIALLSGGHVLLIGVPGLAKTRLVETLHVVLGLEERRVTIAGRGHPLPEPFHVVATQNPLEQEGTYPLPEAQLDRFLLQIDIGYPDIDAERQMLIATTGLAEDKPKPVMSATDLIAAQQLIRRIPVGKSVVEAILGLVRAGRPDSEGRPEVTRHVAWGPGPRASQALMLAVRARAALEGRLAPSVDDVLALAHPVLRHRMALNFAARADGVTLDALIDRLCEPYA